MKTYVVEVLIKKMGPSAVRAGLAAFIGIILAHQGMLAKFGVVYDQASNTLSLHLSTLQEWCDVSGMGLIAAVLMGIQHHTVAAVTGAPQTGAPAPQGGTK
jgi:hypothetical protein